MLWFSTVLHQLLLTIRHYLTCLTDLPMILHSFLIIEKYSIILVFITTLLSHKQYINGGIIWKVFILLEQTGLLKNYRNISQKLLKHMVFRTYILFLR